MHRLAPAILLLLLIAPRMAATPAAAEEPRAPKAKWSFLIFMCDTNDLYPYGPLTMRQVEKVGSTEDAHFVVLRGFMKKDRPSEKIHVRKGRSEVVERLPKVDMGDWRELVKFVRWANERYPAERTLVLLWNHGAGWWEGAPARAAGRTGPPVPPGRGICYDEHTGNHITNFQLGRAMSDCRAILGRPVDILAMDACLMQMMEIAAELAGNVQYVVAHEELEPGTGWPYDRAARILVDDPRMDARAYAAGLVEQHHLAYAGKPGKPEETTCSALDLDRLPVAIRAVDKAARALRAALADPAARAGIERAAARCQRFDERDNADLPHFLELARAATKDPELQLTLAAALRALVAPGGLVVANRTTGKASRNARGVAVYLPLGAPDPEYFKVTTYARGPWGDFIRALRPAGR